MFRGPRARPPPRRTRPPGSPLRRSRSRPGGPRPAWRAACPAGRRMDPSAPPSSGGRRPTPAESHSADARPHASGCSTSSPRWDAPRRAAPGSWRSRASSCSPRAPSRDSLTWTMMAVAMPVARRILLLGALLLATAGNERAARGASRAALAPARMARVGTIDDRFQSYNVEMVEVTGGRFWKPYGSTAAQDPNAGAAGTPAGLSPNLYEYRPPIDLTNARLRRLAAALGPAYVRVSGTWANSTHLPEGDEAPKQPPAGFGGVLTHAQWKGVVEFAHAANARIVTSFATSVGTRDASGVWTTDQARRFLEHTKSLGGEIAAAELMNEPNFAAYGGAPAGYDAAAYGRDFKVFLPFAKQAGFLILGPGSVGETTRDGGLPSPRALKTRDLLTAAGPGLDVFSYHHCGTVSKRCAGAAIPPISPEEALSDEWLSRTDGTLAFYKSLRDEFAPGAPI